MGVLCWHFWSADGREALLQQIERRTLQSKVQSTITWYGLKVLKNVWHGPGHVHTWIVKKKYLARRQTFIRLKYILNYIRHPILFYTLSVFCCFSLRTAQLTANFVRQDPRISWCRFTTTKFNLISDRDVFLEIANGQQIPYNLVCL